MNSNNIEIATLGNGCFWCTEAVFQLVPGVIKVESGYSGGDTINPTYKDICTGTTNHAECLQITFDNTILPYDALLKVFWESHDPTTLNRQGNDVGTQYRSIIFYHNDIQKEIATAFKQQLNEQKIFKNEVVTIIEPFTVFYKAEDYHQNYYNNNKTAGYCQFVIRPKVEKYLAQKKS
ncbi:peptide-methionine (S)-S-oxide reductase MsrA [Ferruginibacter yonginensis]|uniref:Peptide methionine sulfoxide reductase MsrA n=1 Tax=Ferruginibacter yonginensis TaxID=1310416 RepID=A0ABV8QM23_9BACT